jgi:hypothetical protein
MKLATQMQIIKKALARNSRAPDFLQIAADFAAKIRRMKAQPFTAKPRDFDNAINLLSILERRQFVPISPTPPPSQKVMKRGYYTHHPTADDPVPGGRPVLHYGGFETKRRRH